MTRNMTRFLKNPAFKRFIEVPAVGLEPALKLRKALHLLRLNYF